MVARPCLRKSRPSKERSMFRSALVLRQRFEELGGTDCDGAVGDLDSAKCYLLENEGEKLAFKLKDALLHFFGRIAGRDFACSLSDDGTVIKLVVDEVGGAARYLHAIFDHGSVNSHAVISLATKSWDQGWVNVDHAIGEVLRDE